MFFREMMMYGLDTFLDSFLAKKNSCFQLECNFQSIVRANLYLCIDQIAANEEDNFKQNTTHVQINGLFCGGEYLFHLDDCLLFLKAYAKDSFHGRKYCQRLRTQKYAISKEYDKYLKVAVQPLNDWMFQSSTFYVCCENLMKIIESAELIPNMQSR